jgi:hypothetical protein
MSRWRFSTVDHNCDSIYLSTLLFAYAIICDTINIKKNTLPCHGNNRKNSLSFFFIHILCEKVNLHLVGDRLHLILVAFRCKKCCYSTMRPKNEKWNYESWLQNIFESAGISELVICDWNRMIKSLFFCEYFQLACVACVVAKIITDHETRRVFFRNQKLSRWVVDHFY